MPAILKYIGLGCMPVRLLIRLQTTFILYSWNHNLIWMERNIIVKSMPQAQGATGLVIIASILETCQPGDVQEAHTLCLVKRPGIFLLFF